MPPANGLPRSLDHEHVRPAQCPPCAPVRPRSGASLGPKDGLLKATTPHERPVGMWNVRDDSENQPVICVPEGHVRMSYPSTLQSPQRYRVWGLRRRIAGGTRARPRGRGGRISRWSVLIVAVHEHGGEDHEHQQHSSSRPSDSEPAPRLGGRLRRRQLVRSSLARGTAIGFRSRRRHTGPNTCYAEIRDFRSRIARRGGTIRAGRRPRFVASRYGPRASGGCARRRKLHRPAAPPNATTVSVRVPHASPAHRG